jgi:dTDP-4-dehydrorhamnose reductase
MQSKKNHKIVIFGADGLLGKEFVSFFGGLSGFKILVYNRKTADVTDQKTIADIISRERPGVVINCAVVVNGDYCQEHPLVAWNVNALGAGIIAESIQKTGLAQTIFVQISTSEVFSGNKKIYAEDDMPNPVNVYGWSKYGGEKIVEQIGAIFPGHFYIIRAGWLYGAGRDTFVDMVVQALRQNQLKLSATNITFRFGQKMWLKRCMKLSVKAL